MTCRFLGLWLRLLLVCGLVAGAARAEPPSATKALGFSNLVFRLAGGDQVGIADQDFRVHILEDLRGRGFNAVGAENLVFGSDHGSRADLMLGGTVTEALATTETMCISPKDCTCSGNLP